MENILEKLRRKRERLKEKLQKRRLDMADQDGPNESRYITATRWLVEQEISNLDKELTRLDAGIKEMEKLVGDSKRYYDGLFVCDNFECFDLGIISKKTKGGKEILEGKF